jgi:hypothetical protein
MVLVLQEMRVYSHRDCDKWKELKKPESTVNFSPIQEYSVRHAFSYPKNRAEVISPDDNSGDKLHQALNTLGIQEEEFLPVSTESNEL